MRRLLYAALTALLFCVAAHSAHAEGDRVSFLHDIHVTSNEEAHDLVCFACSIHVDGPVHGDTVAFLGSIQGNAPIDGDAVAFLGDITIGPNGHVDKDCVAFLGSVLQHEPGQVGKDVVEFPFILILIPICLIVFIVYLVRALFRRPRPPFPMPPPPPFR
ncbi:hypothetical protein [Silvibacterium dinghuense]|uniref:Polymer-forming cytoskeletal protein n=1 Tax=Silvibacterium dinghuense TaxID=1560006 RepID=A0A4Q1SDE9_9BACT|nr:hypothetical protein [Silvibacterium dinghuense]RXS95259.1 hypothetical protein ESZ00_11725 [Silvibacterium dinghuense]